MTDDKARRRSQSLAMGLSRDFILEFGCLVDEPVEICQMSARTTKRKMRAALLFSANGALVSILRVGHRHLMMSVQ